MNVKNLLEKLSLGHGLTQNQASFLLEQIIAGEVNPFKIAAVLTALRTKGETTEEILGFIKTMRKHMVKIKAPHAIDIVGTGGDGSGSFNISTAACFVVAGKGLPVAKHGNRAASGKCGSADVLEALGVNINLRPDEAEQVFKKIGMVFLFAPNYHPAMKQIAPVRKELGIRTIFNYLGPFLNPASTKKQILGAPDKKTAQRLAEVALKLNFNHLLIVSSNDAMDEISTTSKTKVCEIKDHKLHSYEISPKTFGLKFACKKDLSGGDPKFNADILRNILKGGKGAKRDVVLLNSAAAFYIGGTVRDIKHGTKLAEESIDGGYALKALENLIKETNIYE